MSYCRSIAVCLTLVWRWLGAFREHITGLQIRSLRANYPPTFLAFTLGKILSSPASGSLPLYIRLVPLQLTPSACYVPGHSKHLFALFISTTNHNRTASPVLFLPFTQRHPSHLRLYGDNKHVFSPRSRSSIRSTSSASLVSISRPHAFLDPPFAVQLLLGNSGNTGFPKLAVPACLSPIRGTFRQLFGRHYDRLAHAFRRIKCLRFGGPTCAISPSQFPGTSVVLGSNSAIRKHNTPPKGECDSLDIGALFLFLLRELESLETGSFAVSPDSFWVPISIHFLARSN